MSVAKGGAGQSHVLAAGQVGELVIDEHSVSALAALALHAWNVLHLAIEVSSESVEVGG